MDNYEMAMLSLRKLIADKMRDMANIIENEELLDKEFDKGILKMYEGMVKVLNNQIEFERAIRE